MNFSRRAIVGGTAAATMAHAAATKAQNACAVFTKARQSEVTGDLALRLLKAGNARFAAGQSVHCDLLSQVHATAAGQAPFAAILGCIDSRVPPELVFDQRIGDIFAARVAGNIVNSDILGSLEYCCSVAGAKAIVVLGHSDCGAIKGAIDQVQLGNLTALLRKLDPAVAAAHIAGKRTSKNKAAVQAVANANARLTARAILERSPVLRAMAAKQQIAIAAAMHDVTTGEVVFFA